jgi:purine-cytosine permease-like protein
MSKISAAIVAFSIVWIISYIVARRTIYGNRHVEWDANENLEVSQQNVQWSIIHIRDDIGAIHNLIVIANGLLAGILAALLF